MRLAYTFELGWIYSDKFRCVTSPSTSRTKDRQFFLLSSPGGIEHHLMSRGRGGGHKGGTSRIFNNRVRAQKNCKKSKKLESEMAGERGGNP